MFLQVSVCPRGGVLPHCMLGYTPPPPETGTPPPPGPKAGTLPREQTPPSTVHAGRYVQQAGGTHPTGMQSCFDYAHFPSGLGILS